MSMSVFVPFWPFSPSLSPLYMDATIIFQTQELYKMFATMTFGQIWQTTMKKTFCFNKGNPKKNYQVTMSRHQCCAGHSPNQWQRRTSLKPSCKETGSIGCMIGQCHSCFPWDCYITVIWYLQTTQVQVPQGAFGRNLPKHKAPKTPAYGGARRQKNCRRRGESDWTIQVTSVVRGVWK